MNGEVNGVMEESMDTSSPPASPRTAKKSSSDSLGVDVTNNHSEENDHSNHTDTSNPLEYSTNEDEPRNTNSAFISNNENSNCSTVSKSNEENGKHSATGSLADNHCINSNESYSESSQSDAPRMMLKTNNITSVMSFQTSEDMEYEKEAKATTTNDDTDEEVDSDDDSSEEEGSEGSEEQRAEDTVSINSDSEPDAVEDDSTQDESKQKPDVININLSGSQNGDDDVHEIISDNDDCVLSSESKSNNKKNSKIDGPLRRSNRATKRKSYSDVVDALESDVEEVVEDPLNSHSKSKPIVVNDTKDLVEMATKQAREGPPGQKKEPTVVIIDTNSILSGKGPLPITQSKSQTSMSTTSLNAQHLYESIAARGTTVTPLSSKPNSVASTPITQNPPIILPSLTDDMFVVEAPSFIVPYVYEKPSVTPFKDFVDSLGKELEKQKAKEDQEQLEKDKQEQEKREKERQEKRDRGEPVSEDEEESINDAEIEKTAEEETTSENIEKPSDEADKKKLDEEESPKKRSDKKGRKKPKTDEDDDVSWDGESTSDSEAGSDEEKTVIIKDKEDEDVQEIKEPLGEISNETRVAKSDSYFDNSLGKFFINIGINLVQEFVQNDLLRQQKRKFQREKRAGVSTKGTESAINSLVQNLQFSKKSNAPYAFEQKKCEFCSFKSESMLVMSHHLETPHMKNNVYKCNFCAFEIRSPHDILYHMEAEHNIRGRLERAPAYHQCANCPFEDNGKGKLARHLIPCAKKFKPELNLAPPVEWEPPAKIPKITRARNNMMGSYQSVFNRSQVGATNIQRTPITIGGIMPSTMNNYRPRARLPLGMAPRGQPVHGAPLVRGGLMVRHNAPSMLMTNNYPILPNSQTNFKAGAAPQKMLHQPSISITPLPRPPQPQPAQTTNAKGSFVICEICDGYIKDLEQLRNHMQWIHKVKIHPKMIYNRPPLNCQKCQFRFFTDQGLERHLLGSHGLVTSSMQEAANKGKDAGRCPVCGRVYQWKLLNHVARDHNLTLKPAHLSYKCTVCTATFGMYKQFENHVYSAHSVVAKRVMDKNKTTAASPKPSN